jgi:RNA polymerase sigma factor (sigma-70 family)
MSSVGVAIRVELNHNGASMSPPSELIEPEDSNGEPRAFCTTLWTVVLEAGQPGTPQSQAALDKLCRAYWFPLYAFVRRQGHSPEQAQDLTQEFFRQLLEKNRIQAADRARGRFRSFLLACLKHFLANEWQRGQRQKRGGGMTIFSLDAETAEDRLRLEPADHQTPEKTFDQQWAYALLEQVMERLREEFTESGKADRFEALSAFLLDDEAGSQAEIAARLGMTESAVKSAVHRMRQRYAELLREEIAMTVERPEDVEAEIRELFATFGG